MDFLRKILDRLEPTFSKGADLESLYPLYEAADTIHFSPLDRAKGSAHVRDGLDLKRLMLTVVAALIPCVLWALYNTGYQAAIAVEGAASRLDTWQDIVFYDMLRMQADSTDIVGCLIHGALYFVPVYVTGLAVGGVIEATFAIVRKHEITEGFLVTSLLFPLTLPPTIPLWQVALGIAFGVVIGKEVFGGVGMNVLNPALTGRAFLFFAYPAQISGDQVWIAADNLAADGYSGATYLARAAESGLDTLTSEVWWNGFFGLVPGSMGETSALCALLGAGILIFTQIGSWRTMLGVFVGTVAMAGLLNWVGSETNPMFEIPWHFHVILGGWAFGTVFMATDPVSSAFTERGKLIYGFGIGVMVILIRVVNPAYPEGMMLAILFMNIFAPLIDHFFVQANIKRRQARYGV
ncbi:MAG: NADH:ubiquinone reductase (Na(+)-transporting) subunit B [Nannocystaceae bacterium]|nr:NADH:ubiquinone reductase (Na(+)-transporting) subunit B [Nannocystaceae bacterium]